MSYAVEIIVLDQPSISPKPEGVPTQHLPIMYDTIEDALEAGRDFNAQNKAPPGTVTF